MTIVNRDGHVEFRFFRPQAAQVGVIGDFTEWKNPLQMQPAGDGWWTAGTSLPPGDYRFRYVADGAWFTDYASHGVEFTPGGWNAVLVVPKRPAQQATDAADRPLAGSGRH